MLRWLATVVIVALLGLVLWLPSSPLGARGPEAEVRADFEGFAGEIGTRLPDLDLVDLEGNEIDLADFRGHPLIVTFERSVDW